MLGGYRLRDGQTVWQNGPVIEAMERGAVLLLDEIDLASNKIMCLQPILEGNCVFVKKINNFIKTALGFTVCTLLFFLLFLLVIGIGLGVGLPLLLTLLVGIILNFTFGNAANAFFIFPFISLTEIGYFILTLSSFGNFKSLITSFCSLLKSLLSGGLFGLTNLGTGVSTLHNSFLIILTLYGFVLALTVPSSAHILTLFPAGKLKEFTSPLIST